jgi:hypothetical protein
MEGSFPVQVAASECRIAAGPQIQIDRNPRPDTILPILPVSSSHYPYMDISCKHPRVRVVAREEDVEYVECQECGEVFDSGEFRDMAIEDTQEIEEEG